MFKWTINVLRYDYCFMGYIFSLLYSKETREETKVIDMKEHPQIDSNDLKVVNISFVADLVIKQGGQSASSDVGGK